MWRIILLLAGSAWCAPYCVQLSYTKQCWYFDANECQEKAREQNGLCVSNMEPRQVAPTPMSSSLQSSLQGIGNIGSAIDSWKLNEARRKNDEAQTELLRLQTEKIKIELQEKAIQFDQDHPGSPNPYRQTENATEDAPIKKTKVAASGELLLAGSVCTFLFVVGIIALSNN